MSLRDKFIKFITEYRSVFEKVWRTGVFKDDFGNFVRHDIPDELGEIARAHNFVYFSKGSVGQTRWTPVPWLAVFDNRITRKATEGEYIVYLLNSETKELYLTFNQASQGKNNAEVRKKLQEKAGNIRSKLSFPHSVKFDPINSGNAAYDAGCICYIKYSVETIPDDSMLKQDLKIFLDIYAQYYSVFFLSTSEKKSSDTYETTISTENSGEQTMTAKEQIEAVKNYIAAKGFIYDGALIENFYLSLKSKPFVILAGTSGTGKTRLVRLFAEAINAEYKLVAVRPDWSDSSDLFGHVDLNQKFIPGAVIDFVKKAEADPEKPYFLCLDEMNLARVEYYMSDILSAIETRRFDEKGIITDPVFDSVNYGNDTAAAERYGDVVLPGNLYIIGTVNMDETTFPFSKKVLDRANTIEFSHVDLSALPAFDSEEPESFNASNNFLVSEYIKLNDCSISDMDYISLIAEKLAEINKILKTADAHVGYRVRDEIVFYMLNNKKAELLDENTAFDNQIMQKILPRVHGSSSVIKTMLEELGKHCESDKYVASAEKIKFMIKRFEDDGFTSYWL